MSRVRFVSLLACAFFFASSFEAGARDRPPSVPPPRPAVLPAPALRVLPNGLQVVVIQRRTLPLVTLRLVVKVGAEGDPPHQPGIAEFLGSLLGEGTTHRSAQEIAGAIDSVGGEFDSGADWDSSFVSLTVLDDYTEFAFELVSDITIHPAFAPEEIERKRKQTLSALELVRQDPDYLADAALRRILFSGTSYGHPLNGTWEAVSRMTAGDLHDFYARYYQPANCILAVVGDVSPEEALDRTLKFFGGWKNKSPLPLPSAPEAATAARQVLVIDKPDAVQTEIRVGSPGVPRASLDYYALTVANQVLGGPATNRLFKTLRTQQGLTYAASSDLNCYRSEGKWVVKTSTRTSETVKCLRTVLDEIKRLRDHPVSNLELDNAQRYLAGHLALQFESSEQIADEVLELMVNNLPLDYWNRFPEKIQELSTGDVWNATRRYLDAERDVIVLVGNAQAFSRELRKFGAVRVIPVRDVDFASPDLERLAAPSALR